MRTKGKVEKEVLRVGFDTTPLESTVGKLDGLTITLDCSGAQMSVRLEQAGRTVVHTLDFLSGEHLDTCVLTSLADLAEKAPTGLRAGTLSLYECLYALELEPPLSGALANG